MTTPYPVPKPAPPAPRPPAKPSVQCGIAITHRDETVSWALTFLPKDSRTGALLSREPTILASGIINDAPTLASNLTSARLAVLGAFSDSPEIQHAPEAYIAAGDRVLRQALMDSKTLLPHMQVYQSPHLHHPPNLPLQAAQAHALSLFGERGIGYRLITAATDGSHRINTSSGGWGYATDAGQYGCGRCKTSNSLVAELVAIYRLLLDVHPSNPLIILTDSRGAICAIQSAYDLEAPEGISRKARNLAIGIANHMDGRHVEFQWVKSHNGDPLNEFADRLAVHGRRAYDSQLTKEESRVITQHIGEELQAWITSQAQTRKTSTEKKR